MLLLSKERDGKRTWLLNKEQSRKDIKKNREIYLLDSAWRSSSIFFATALLVGSFLNALMISSASACSIFFFHLTSLASLDKSIFWNRYMAAFVAC